MFACVVQGLTLNNLNKIKWSLLMRIAFTLKNKPFLIKVCDVVIAASIYGAVFLLPISFAPWTSDALDFNKQALLFVLVFTGLLAWFSKSFISGVFYFNSGKIGITAGILFLVYLLSTIFSVSRHGSFWGWPQPVSDSLLSIVLFCGLYFLASANLSEKRIFNSFVLLAVSFALAQLYGVLQLAGAHIIPFDFTKNSSFNTIGSVGSLGLFAAVLLPMFMAFLAAVSDKRLKAIFISNIVLTFAVILLVNYEFIWIVSLIGSAAIILFWFIRRDIFDGKKMYLPIFFAVISLFFIVFAPQVKWLSVPPQEISLSHKASLEISLGVPKKNIFLGSGPGAFNYDFAKYRDKSFNKNILWNVEFNEGSSKFLTILATTGLLGFVALSALIIFSLFYGAKTLIFGKFSGEPIKISLILAAFSSLFAGTAGYFLYNSNMSLDFILFFSIAALAALIFENKEKNVLLKSSLFSIVVAFIFASVVVFGLGILALESQRYIANINYRVGLKSFSRGEKDEAAKRLKTAAEIDKKTDLYFRDLAVFFLSDLRDKMLGYKSGAPSDEDKKKVEALILSSASAANAAVTIGPQNFANWATRGYVCKNLIGLNRGAFDCAVESYNMAIELSPSNPLLFLQQGIAYLAEADNLSPEQKQNKNEILSKAEDRFLKAVDLKEDYFMAYLQMAIVARIRQNTDAMRLLLEKASRYSSGDADLSFQIGLVYYQSNIFFEAQKEFQKVLFFNPVHQGALYYLGLIYDKQGQKDDAIREFSKLLKLAPQNQDIQKILGNLKVGKAALDGFLGQPPVAESPTNENEKSGGF